MLQKADRSALLVFNIELSENPRILCVRRRIEERQRKCEIIAKEVVSRLRGLCFLHSVSRSRIVSSLNSNLDIATLRVPKIE